MSRIVRVHNDDYSIVVDNGSSGTITLDTTGDSGSIQGTTVIKGNLQVLGTTTTVESETVTIDDNIIVLNDGETGAGINASVNYKSGVELDRGSLNNARIVFDEQTAFYTAGSSGTGSFKLEDSTGAHLPLSTNSIHAQGTLYLTTPGSHISVAGEANYEENVYRYSSGTIVDLGGGYIIDDDAIPNAKAVNDLVTYRLTVTGSNQIVSADTKVRALDEDVTLQESRVAIEVDGLNPFNFYSNRTELHNIRIQDNQISTLNADSTSADLILSAGGTGSIRADDAIIITNTTFQAEDALAPTAPSEGVKVYGDTVGAGNTGLHFINSASISSELISKDKALLFAMLF